MPRASEFEWRGCGKPKRRLWPLLLIIAGFTAAYSFLQPYRDSTGQSLAIWKPAQNETSAIASGEPATDAERVENEPSAIAIESGPARVEIMNTPPSEHAPTSRSTPSGRQAAPNYPALRRELLSNLR
jgi:hypothetical protein